MKRFKKIIAIPAAFVLGMALAFLVLQIREVRVEGSKFYSEQEIIQSAMSEKYSYHALYFFVKSRLGGISCLPFVQEIDVEWRGLDKITLHVYEKTISGCVKYMGQYVYFDKDGIVLQSLVDTMEGVPVVTGIPFGKFTLNQAFEVEDPTLFDSIMNLSQLINHYHVKVDQIRFHGKEVTLYAGKIQIYLGQKDFYDDDIAALSSVLKKAGRKGFSGTINMERYEPGDKIILDSNDTVQDTGAEDGSGDGQDSEDGSGQGTEYGGQDAGTVEQ